MSVYLLYRTRYTPEQFVTMLRGGKQVAAKLKKAKAAAPMTVWQRPDIPEAHLILLEYQELETAAVGLDVFTNLASKIDSEGFQGEGAPDALLVQVLNRAGVEPKGAPIGSLLSLSMRIAEPGYADVLVGDLEMVFQGLQSIGGFLGWSYGNRVGVGEEILGIGLWAGQSDFEASLPAGGGHIELRLYRRVL